MVPLKKHIFIYAFSVLFSLAVISGILMFGISSNIYRKAMVSELKETAEIVMAMSGDTPEDTVEYFRGNDSMRLRLTYIGPSGEVLADSHHEQFTMENHSERPEIRQAFRDGLGSDIRKSATDGQRYLYTAVRCRGDYVLRLSVPYYEYEHLLQTLLWWIGLGTLAVVVIAFLLSLCLSRWIVRPIDEFGALISKVADGEESVRAGEQKVPELRALAEDFNKMSEKLISKIRELSQKSTEINHIISNMNEGFIAVNEQKLITLMNPKAVEFLHIASSQPVGRNIFVMVRDMDFIRLVTHVLEGAPHGILDMERDSKCVRVFASRVEHGGMVLFLQDVTLQKKAEQMRAEFTANVSHELKTPLTSIKGFAETLRDGALENKEVAKEFLNIIGIEADRLYSLIQDILQISELESMKCEVDLSRCKIRKVVDKVVGLLKQMAEKQKISIHTEVEDVELRANQNRIQQLILNLMDNAIKYGNEGGNVWINAVEEGGNLVLTVRDDGPGILQEDLARIFERFYRTEKSRSKKMGGTGLGLSIVKHIVNLYKGTVEVKSEIGKGTVFTVVLPIEDSLQET